MVGLQQRQYKNKLGLDWVEGSSLRSHSCRANRSVIALPQRGTESVPSLATQWAMQGRALWVSARTDLFSKQAGGCLLVGCGLQTIKPPGLEATDQMVDLGAGQSLAEKEISAPAASHKP